VMLVLGTAKLRNTGTSSFRRTRSSDIGRRRCLPPTR
jgi:hypothetical protein